MTTQLETIPLGRTDIQITPMGLGAWQWGDRLIWGYGGAYSAADVRPVFKAAMDAGVNFVDTAEAYGRGTSERLLGRFIREAGTRPVVATKLTPMPWRLRPDGVRKALQASLNRLALSQVDVYQVHFPLPLVPIRIWMNALADVQEAGLTRAVGVSNFNVDQTSRAHAALLERKIMLASNQVEYSLLARGPERSGLLELCQQFKITLIAYSPIAKGLLTGKYTPNHPLPGLRSRLYKREYVVRVQPLIGLLREIGQAHGGKTPAQVSLNWVMCKGAVPIPGAKHLEQIQENLGALGWRLTADEVKALDEASDRLGR